MSTVASFRAELDAVQQLLIRQRELVSADDLSQLQSAQCEAFVRKINTITDLSLEAIANLTELIANGNWCGSHKSRLTMSLSTALIHADTYQQRSDRRKGQENTTFQHWAIQSEAEIFADPLIAFPAKLQLLCKMLHRLGMILPSERSKGHFMKVMLAACPEYTRTLSPDTAWDLYQDLKRKVHLEFKNVRKPGPMGFIQYYPDHPQQLPQSQFNMIFADQAPVTLCDGNAIADAAEILALRGNSSKLTTNKKCNTLQQQPLQLQLPCASPQQQPAMHPFMNQFASFMAQQMCHQTSGMPCMGDVPLHLFPGAGSGQHVAPGAGSCQQFAPPRVGQFKGAGSSLALMDSPGSPNSPLTVPRAEMAGTDTKTTLSPAKQAARFMQAMAGKSIDDGTDDDDEEDDDGDGDADVLKKPASKAKSSAKAKPKGKAKGKAKGKPKTAKGLLFTPIVQLEASRSQFLFRPGLPFSVSGESTKNFSFDVHGGKAKAEKAANRWLETFKSSHRCK